MLPHVPCCPTQPSDPTWFLGTVTAAYGRFVQFDIVTPSGVSVPGGITLGFVFLKDQSASSQAFLVSSSGIASPAASSGSPVSVSRRTARPLSGN